MPQFIKKMRIRNFRSVVDEIITLSDENISVFVGNNDAGKSNLLRALNLFFHGNTDFNTRFRFGDDYSFFAETGKGKAREVRIDLWIEPPSRLANARTVFWSKAWREDGPGPETLRYVKKDAKGRKRLGQGAGVHSWVNKLQFRYIPAQKGADYFSKLMGELHDVLNEVHQLEFSESSSLFIEKIQEISEDIADEIESLIGIESRIQAPTDFSELFSSLDFGQTIEQNTFLLKRRGDGIRAWHIPIILSVMAQKERQVIRKGFVLPDTVWGFEEPENNLELSNAFRLSEQLVKFSGDIQVFLTTHSPAFYALGETLTNKSKTYFVAREDGLRTKLIDVDMARIDRDMGILDLITPAVVSSNLELEKIRNEYEDLAKRAFEKPVVILTEDKNTESLRTVVESSNLREYEIISYDGCSKIDAAFSFARLISKKTPDAKIIVHRDRDYLSDDEIQELSEKASKAKCNLFLTEGNEVESHFLIPDYISAVGEITEELAAQIIEEATDECEEKSLDALSKSKDNRDGSWYYSKYKVMYQSDVKRFRDSKAVWGCVKRIYKDKTKNNFPGATAHPALSHPKLKSIADALH